MFLNTCPNVAHALLPIKACVIRRRVTRGRNDRSVIRQRRWRLFDRRIRVKTKPTLTSSESRGTVASSGCWRNRATGWSRSAARRARSGNPRGTRPPAQVSWPTVTAVARRSWPPVPCPTWPPLQTGSCWWSARPAALPSPYVPGCSSSASGRTR